MALHRARQQQLSATLLGNHFTRLLWPLTSCIGDKVVQEGALNRSQVQSQSTGNLVNLDLPFSATMKLPWLWTCYLLHLYAGEGRDPGKHHHFSFVTVTRVTLSRVIAVTYELLPRHC